MNKISPVLRFGIIHGLPLRKKLVMEKGKINDMDMNTKVEKLTKYHTVFTQDASDVSLTEGIIEKTEATDN